ncbi:hypothetical protein EJB05_14348, partial [Eragrostis curvula]
MTITRSVEAHTSQSSPRETGVLHAPVSDEYTLAFTSSSRSSVATKTTRNGPPWQSSTEHHGRVDKPNDASLRHAVLITRDGVPDNEIPAIVIRVEEDAAVVAVEGAAEVGIGAEGYCRGGNEAGFGISFDDSAPLDVAKQRRRPVEGAVAAEEPGVGDDAEPGLADEGCADQVLGFVWWEAEEDLGGNVVDELRRRRHGEPFPGRWSSDGGGGEVSIGFGTWIARSVGKPRSERGGLLLYLGWLDQARPM